MLRRWLRINRKSAAPYLMIFSVAVVLWCAAVPVTDAFRLRQTNYIEGWSVYNAQIVAEHRQLYPTTYDWIAVKYPPLSFHIIAALSRITSDYLFTGRALSLLGLVLTGVFAALIVWHLTRSRFAAWMTGLFMVGIFCANANSYPGMDDPQLFAQAFYVAALYVYIRGGRKGWAIEATALLLALAINIKHSLIEFPIAILIDLCFTSPRRALRLAFAGALLGAVSAVLAIHFDGPAYIACLLASRRYAILGAIAKTVDFFLPILPIVLVALWTARSAFKNPAQRVLAILLFCALPLNSVLSGGGGTATNQMFGSLIAIVLLVGIFFADFPALTRGRLSALQPSALCALFFLWLALVPFTDSHFLFISHTAHWRTIQTIRERSESERLFALRVDFLRRQPGPALCESLLTCYYAGKRYIYEPQNATRFIAQGKLDPAVMVNRLRNHEFGAVQMDYGIQAKLSGPRPDRNFAVPILLAVQAYYSPGYVDREGTIYLPKDDSQKASPNLAESH